MEIDTHPATELSKQTFVFWDEILYILRLYIFSKILNNIENVIKRKTQKPNILYAT